MKNKRDTCCFFYYDFINDTFNNKEDKEVQTDENDYNCTDIENKDQYIEGNKEENKEGNKEEDMEKIKLNMVRCSIS
jgi:hypothetical protein